MAAKREVWRETLQHKTGGEWEARVLIAYCGSKEISACICICGVDPTLPSNVEETFKLKGAKINHANFQSQNSTPEKALIPRNEFQLTTSDNVTLEFRLQNGRNCFDWTKLLTILTEFPNMRVPKEPQTAVTFHSKPDPYLYGSDSVWAVYIMHEGVGRRGLVVGVNVVALRNAVRGVSPGILDIIYPQDPTNKIASWEHGKIKTVGRIGKLVFLEIGEECKPGGPGHVWMFVGYGEALGLCETIKNFLLRGDGTPVVIQDTQLLPKFEIMHCFFHSDTVNESRSITTTHTDEHPHPAEESDLPSLELQQRSLYEQIKEDCRIPETVVTSTPDISISLPSSPRTTQRPQLKRLVLELRDMYGWFHLGVYLGIPRPFLDQIHAKHVASLDTTEKCKIDMLSTWQENSENCTWSALVTALHQTGRAGLARRIATKHGVMDSGQPSQTEDSVRQAFMDIAYNSQQAATILSMQKTIEMEDRKLLETVQHLKEQKRYNQTLEQELKKIREELNFSERYRGMQMSDIQQYQTRKRDNEVQVHTLATTVQNLTEIKKERYLSAQGGEALLSPEIERELQQSTDRFFQKREESDEISQQLSQSYSNQKSAQKEAKDLKERIGVLTSQCENVARACEQLQKEKEELTTALKTHEKDLDQKLIGRGQQHEQKALEDCNWIMHEDRRAELKLRESELETCTERLEEKEAQIRMLTDRLENKSRKLRDVEERIQKLSQVTSSEYATIMELHVAEQTSTTLALERLQYKIQLSNEEASKRELQFQASTLSEGVNETIAILEAMRERIAQPTKPSDYIEPILQTRMSYSAQELRDLVPALPKPTSLEMEPPSYRNRTTTSPPVSQIPLRHFNRRNDSASHTSEPISEHFALINSGYKRTLASSAPKYAVDSDMPRRRVSPQETTSYNMYSRFDDRRAPPSLPNHRGFHTVLPQYERGVPRYDPPRRGSAGTVV